MLFHPSITQYERTEAFELQVARGLIDGHKSVTVFGYNPDVDQTEVTVWPLPILMQHPTVAIQMKVTSTNANDTAAGTGARTILIEGLDSNYNEISEIVTMNGLTTVLTTQLFLRINRATVVSAGSAKGALGDIYMGDGIVTAGIPAIVYNIIKYDFNNTVTGHYTIPAGYTGYLVQGLFSVGQPSGSAEIRGRLMTTNQNGINHTNSVVALNNGSADYTFEFPVAIPEKTDIEARVVGVSNNNAASSMFIICLIANLIP